MPDCGYSIEFHIVGMQMQSFSWCFSLACGQKPGFNMLNVAEWNVWRNLRCFEYATRNDLPSHADYTVPQNSLLCVDTESSLLGMTIRTMMHPW